MSSVHKGARGERKKCGKKKREKLSTKKHIFQFLFPFFCFLGIGVRRAALSPFIDTLANHASVSSPRQCESQWADAYTVRLTSERREGVSHAFWSWCVSALRDSVGVASSHVATLAQLTASECGERSPSRRWEPLGGGIVRRERRKVDGVTAEGACVQHRRTVFLRPASLRRGTVDCTDGGGNLSTFFTRRSSTPKPSERSIRCT